MNKKLIGAFAGVALTFSACGDAERAEKQVLGGILIGSAANAMGASNDESILIGTAGAIGIGILDRAQNAGCRLGSSPARNASLVFRNVKDGAYLNCPSVGLGNRAVQELRTNPEWVLQTSNRPTRSTSGGVAPIRPFR